MKSESKSKGTWTHRLSIRLFTVVLAVLMYWVLGFFVGDIGLIPGPDYDEIEQKYLDKDLVARQFTLATEIEDLTRQIANQKEKQSVVGDSSSKLQQTITQLIDLQKLALQKGIFFSEVEQATFANSMKVFLDNQAKYQELSQAISDMLEKKQAIVRSSDETERRLAAQRRPAAEEFNLLSQEHRVRLAFLQLAVLLPILVAAAIVIVKKRSSIYLPLFLAVGVASLIKVGLVVHAWFPDKYFKYILIGGLVIVVAKLLIYLIRTTAFPKAASLNKQYREAYERFLCPVCEYPIRVGPRRFLFWTRRTVNKIVVPGVLGGFGGQGDQEETYTCPSCGSNLFEECASCHKVRHAMLPNCSHCGSEKEVS